jgi:hypothetical protein
MHPELRKKIFIRVATGVIAGLIMVVLAEFVWSPHVLRWSTAVCICSNCGAKQVVKEMEVFEHEFRLEAATMPTALSLNLAKAASRRCDHRFQRVAENNFAFRKRWPLIESSKTDFPIDLFLLTLAAIAQTNTTLARSTLTYALIGDPSDRVRQDFLKKADFIGLAALLQRTNVSYPPDRAGPNGWRNPSQGRW